MKRTDYVGELVYENDQLQFINHEEGRVVTAETKLVYTNSCETTSDVTAQNATLSTVTIDSEKYIKAVATGTERAGIFPIGGDIPVQPGERYKIRVKAYRMRGTASVSHPANLLLKVDANDFGWPGVLIPAGAGTVKTESWIEQIVTIPANGSLLQVGVAGNTFSVGEELYVNEVEIIKLGDGEPEYQYFIKDHLGNVRLVFTTRNEVETSLATLETDKAAAESSQFLYYDEAVKVNQPIFDHTKSGATTYATRLNGTPSERYGLTKSISVMPGDVIETEVWGKYVDPNPGNLTAALEAFLASIANGSAPQGTIIDGGAPGSIGGGTLPLAALMARGSETENGPKAYLNYLVFDRNYTLLNQGYRRMPTSAKENGSNVPHQKLVFSGSTAIKIKEPGYVYIYLSYEPIPEQGDMILRRFILMILKLRIRNRR